MGNSLIFILASVEEKLKLKEIIEPTFQVIDELGEFFYLEEELSLFERLEDHYRLEEYYQLLGNGKSVVAFSSNYSRTFWSLQLKKFRSSFDSVHVFNLKLLKENVKEEGRAIHCESYLKQLMKFMLFWNKDLKIQQDVLRLPLCDYYFTLKPIGLLRLGHYKQLASRHEFKFFYLEGNISLKGFQFFYEHCLSLVLKEVLGLFHEHQSSRHTSR